MDRAMTVDIGADKQDSDDIKTKLMLTNHQKQRNIRVSEIGYATKFQNPLPPHMFYNLLHEN